ncbi:Potassium-transporting ATPase C chain [compost metagenome]
MSGVAAKLYQAEQGPVPQALLTTSGSGLDPHLPPEAVAYQIPRVAAARKVPVERLQALQEEATLHPLIGPPVVNVLALNQALDKLGR